jgi:hypothetical protein
MSLFKAEQLARAIDHKDRSYEFLKLFSEDKFRLRGKLTHIPLQETELSNFEKFKTMVLAHYLYLPENSRPATTDDRDVNEFCNFFLSYLFSSFEYVSNPKPRLITETGCYCDLCARLTSAPYLKLKKVKNRDKRKADIIQREVVRELASSAGLSLADEQEEELLRDESLTESLALVSYGLELIRRCKGERSDPSSLVLWRRFAWNKSGSPKKDFTLQAEMILDAEELLESKIREFGTTKEA